jgi:hypothetical protein
VTFCLEALFNFLSMASVVTFSIASTDFHILRLKDNVIERYSFDQDRASIDTSYSPGSVKRPLTYLDSRSPSHFFLNAAYTTPVESLDSFSLVRPRPFSTHDDTARAIYTVPGSGGPMAFSSFRTAPIRRTDGVCVWRMHPNKQSLHPSLPSRNPRASLLLACSSRTTCPLAGAGGRAGPRCSSREQGAMTRAPASKGRTVIHVRTFSQLTLLSNYRLRIYVWLDFVSKCVTRPSREEDP